MGFIMFFVQALVLLGVVVVINKKYSQLGYWLTVVLLLLISIMLVAISSYLGFDPNSFILTVASLSFLFPLYLVYGPATPARLAGDELGKILHRQVFDAFAIDAELTEKNFDMLTGGYIFSTFDNGFSRMGIEEHDYVREIPGILKRVHPRLPAKYNAWGAQMELISSSENEI